MKVVINKCYGGFSLSPRAVARLAELNGQKAYFFTGGFGNIPLKSVSVDKIKDMFWSAYNTPQSHSISFCGRMGENVARGKR